MAITDITARYLNSIEESRNSSSPSGKILQPTSRTNSPTKFKKPDKHEDLDALARALNITPSKASLSTSSSSPTKTTTTSILRSKFESPSATVSSFKSSDSSIGKSSSSLISTSTSTSSPTKKNHFEIGSDETPSWANKNYKDVLKRSPTKLSTPLKPLSQPIDTPSSKRPFLSSPSNNASKDSPGYEYLCRIEAIKLWLQDILEEDIQQSAAELISYIRNGIYLAKLANVILPNERNVFMNDSKLQFKHTENINRFFQLLDMLNMPDLFRFELTDLYDAKNVPKVWFCLHALSYILNKQDPTYPKMGNLVGNIEFEDEDIRSANRALVSAPLPNFSGAHGGDNDEQHDGMKYMKKVTSPVKKILSPIKQPEFLKNISLSPPRIKQDDPFIEEKVQQTPPNSKTNGNDNDIDIDVDTEPIEFKIRLPVIFESSNKKSDYYTPELEQHMTNIVKFQSLARGAVFRYLMFVDKILLKSYQDEFTTLFSIIRGNLTRSKTIHRHRDDLRDYAFEITELQSLIRKKFALAKKPVVTDNNNNNILQFQCIIRGKLQRNNMTQTMKRLDQAMTNVVEFQSIIRMKKIYSKTGKIISNKDQFLPSMIELQSIARRQLYQKSALCKDIDENAVIKLQSIIRRNAVIDDLCIKVGRIRATKRTFIELQSIARGGITRTRLCKNVLVTLIYEDGTLNELFAKIRGNKVRKTIDNKKNQLLKYENSSIIPVQTLFRGILSRVKREFTLADTYDQIESIIQLQSIARGWFVRKEFSEFDAYYKQNIKQVIKAQAILKRIFDQNAYRTLISSKNPSLSVIRRFATLLSNSDHDFEDELAVSSMRDSIIDKCRINEDLENQIQQLDMKLALLDKNKISIEEFIKPTSKSYKPVVENVKKLEKLTKSSQKRIELYQSFFYFLQTNPIYFTKLYHSIAYNKKDTKFCKELFQLILQVFPVRDSSITAHSREEYFFIKLIILLMKADMSRSQNVSDITKSHLTHWIEFFMSFNNHTFQRQHLKLLCGKFVIRLIDSDELDFESDPIRIHDNIVAHEIKVHGFSNRPRDVSPQLAIQLPDVSSKFVDNLMALRESSSELLGLLEVNISKIPDHVRLISRQAYLLSQRQFPDKSDQQHLAVAGVIFIKHYIGSILQIPGNYGISSKGSNGRSKDNLKHLHRVMLQLFSMKLFNDNFLKPLNEYISSTIDRVESIIRHVIDVDNEIESVYEFNDYDDIVTHQRPKLTMNTNSISQLEKIIYQNIDNITAGNDDQMYKICMQLHNLVSTPQDIMSFAELSNVVLNLVPNTAEEPVVDSKTRTLFTQAKRCLLYIIRVQEGDDLLELLISGIKPIHEEKFKEEKAAMGIIEGKNKPFYNISLGGDVSKMSYHELKKMCLEIMLKLESMGELTRRNSFQELLNQIALDIKTKDSQRKIRMEQLQASEKTIRKLSEKERFLRKQLHDYNRHVDSVLGELQSKPKDKKLFNIIPVFSKQYFYLRELRKRNRLPKFGSYKYSAKKLMDQKVLVDHMLHSTSASKLDFMFSCHQAGKFTIEVASGTVNIPGALNTITLDELLALQYENKSRFDMFDGKVTFDLDNFMALIFRKFYDIKKD